MSLHLLDTANRGLVESYDQATETQLGKAEETAKAMAKDTALEESDLKVLIDDKQATMWPSIILTTICVGLYGLFVFGF